MRMVKHRTVEHSNTRKLEHGMQKLKHRILEHKTLKHSTLEYRTLEHRTLE